MNFFNKLIAISIALIVGCGAFLNASAKDDVLAYQKNRLSLNPNIEIIDLKLDYTKDLKQDNWFGYSFDIRFKIKQTGKTSFAKDVLFSNGKLITFDLLDMKTQRSFKDQVRSSLGEEYFDDKRRIAGSKNAKTKIMVFSDPLCPYCQGYNPGIIKHVKKYSKNLALYYFNFPLSSIHKASTIVSQTSTLAHLDKVKDVKYNLYTAKFSKSFLPDETDEQKILDAVNKALGTKYTLKQVKAKKIVDIVQNDIALGDKAEVRATPTVFINGEYTSNPRDALEYK